MQPSATIQQIYALYQQGQHVQAELAVRPRLEGGTADADILRLGALTALALKQTVTAQQRLTEALKTFPMNAETANTMGNILKASAEWGDAEKYYLDAMRRDGNYAPARANYVDMLVQSGQSEKAVKETERQIIKYGPSDLLHLAAAKAFVNMGQFDDASDAISHIKQPDAYPQLATLKANLFFHKGDYDSLTSLWESLPETSQQAFGVMTTLVNAHAMRGEIETCRALMEAARQKFTRQPQMFIKSARLLDRVGDKAAAARCLSDAAKHFGPQPDILSEESIRALRSGHPDKASQLAIAALRLRPGDFSIMLNCAQALLTEGRYDDCHGLIQSALIQAPNNQFLYALMATLQRKTAGNYQRLYDYENYIRTYDLTPPEGYENMATFNADLKKALDKQHRFQTAPLNQSLRGGTQTDLDLYYADDPIIQMFFAQLAEPIGDYMKHIGKGADHPLTRRNTGKYRINGAWSVRLAPNGHHVNHVHPMGWLSSSYYVDVPDIVADDAGRHGWIKFGEPGIDGLDLPAEKFIKPRAGRLVLFPSYMWHGTIPFAGEQSRLTLPFDVVPA